jgi:hypothetical protein
MSQGSGHPENVPATGRAAYPKRARRSASES